MTSVVTRAAGNLASARNIACKNFRILCHGLLLILCLAFQIYEHIQLSTYKPGLSHTVQGLSRTDCNHS